MNAEDVYIVKICPNEQCQHAEVFVQVKSLETGTMISKELTKEALSFCFLCNSAYTYIATKDLPRKKSIQTSIR